MTQCRDIAVNVTRNDVIVTLNPRGGDVTANVNRVVVRCSNPRVIVQSSTVQARINQTVRTPVVRAVELELVTLAVRGFSGANGQGIVTVPFEWNSITVLPITISTMNKAVLKVDVCIVEPFNGIAPSLSVGDSSSHQNLMDTSENDPSLEATFSVYPGYRYSSNTQVNLYINPGSGVSAGSGVASIVIEQ